MTWNEWMHDWNTWNEWKCEMTWHEIETWHEKEWTKERTKEGTKEWMNECMHAAAACMRCSSSRSSTRQQLQHKAAATASIKQLNLVGGSDRARDPTRPPNKGSSSSSCISREGFHPPCEEGNEGTVGFIIHIRISELLRVCESERLSVPGWFPNPLLDSGSLRCLPGPPFIGVHTCLLASKLLRVCESERLNVPG